MDETAIYWGILHCAIAAIAWSVCFVVTTWRRMKRVEQKLDLLLGHSSRCLQCGAESVTRVDGQPLCFLHAQNALKELVTKREDHTFNALHLNN
ncbi:MAG TPA: hypothetical protein VFD58_25890 [Blastocatellia bacterium]|nr:hypothetical protein [Blastocatellia bacterium]